MGNLNKNSVYFEIEASELNRFRSVIDDMAKATNKAWSKVVRNMARDICRILIKNTPMAPKKRSMRVKSQTKYSKNGNVWVITKHKYTGETVKFPGTQEQSDKYGVYMEGYYQKVRNRGFLKSGWVAALYKLGVTPKTSIKSTKFGQVTQTGYGSKTEIMLKNTVPFSIEFDYGRNRWHAPQHLIERAIREAINRWERVLSRYEQTGTMYQGIFSSINECQQVNKIVEKLK